LRTSWRLGVHEHRRGEQHGGPGEGFTEHAARQPREESAAVTAAARDLWNGDEAIQSAPRERERDEPELHEQHAPVTG
jgi:hypothetical protein